MNELIKQLAARARYDSTIEKCFLEEVHKKEITADQYRDIYDKKFAELIVRECTYIAARAQDENMGWDISGIIKEHFGVDE